MKKLVLIAAAFVLMLPAAFAQKGLHAGLKVTPASVWMFNSSDSDEAGRFDFVSTIGYSLGGSFNYHFTDGFGAGFDLLYSSQGQKFTSLGVEGKRSLNYLKVPILIHFNTNSDAVAYFQGQLGVQLGFLTGSSLKDADGNETGAVGTIIAAPKDAYNSMNLGIVFGFGVGFNVHENFKIHAGFRLDGAFADAEDKEYAPLGVPFWSAFPGGLGRAVTRNVTGGVELGFIYVLPID
ncbi:hypothetical protein BH09BAC1_BH09BAC1_23320 [soil metagenome]